MDDMKDFRAQLKEDIELIQKEYYYLSDQMQEDDYAFNYWVLSNLYGLDEESCSDNVTENSYDKGIDCFVHYEDMKELYIIQNKYYDANTSVNPKDVTAFLETPLAVLLAGEYGKRSEELQKIFDCVHGDSDYKIWLHFYVTNDLKNPDVDKLINQFAFCDDRVSAFVGVKFYRLSDIRHIYYQDRFTNKVDFTATLTTKFSATSLDVRPKDYGLDWMIDLRFVMVNVADLYNLYKEAEKIEYELFEENVREFLGTQGINNGIIKTLQSPEDRENFFYYNNGITIICETCETLRGIEASKRVSDNKYGFELKNPQIVNGCQTINSIVEVLSHCNENNLSEEFARAYVLVKIYVFDEKTKAEKEGLDKNIVKFTNSQNGIDEKAFAAKQDYFLNIQKEFEKRGVLLLVKPSDKYQYSQAYKNKEKFGKLKIKSTELFQLFGKDNSGLNSYEIRLEKMLKVLLAFQDGGYAAFVKGCSVLKPNSQIYKTFSLNIDKLFTIDNMIRIYFLFNKADTDQKASDDKRTPIPYYVISFLGVKFREMDFDQRNEKLKQLFSNKEMLEQVYEFYKNVTSYYAEEYEQAKGIEYNKMIKKEVDAIILDKAYNHMIKYNAKELAKEFLESLG